ncbi:MAG: dihydroorotase [Bacteroidetes bacterium]|nr:dihydroorotase [Bacteroidota bacterium]
MKVLIKQARITDSSSPFHGQVKDILIEDDLVKQVSDQISADSAQVIAQENLHVSIGWMDVFASFPDPGYEHKESLESGSAAAAAGGFTDVMILPNSNPAISSKSQVEYVLAKAAGLPVHIYPIGSVTKNTEGKELTEMYDMHNSGAIAFGDGIQPVQSPGVLLKALQYVLPLHATVIQVPDDRSISKTGLMNEGIVSTRLGLPGKPAIAEELMIARDIELLKYTGSRLHFTGVSTKKGMDMIREAKAAGLQASVSVTPYHVWFCDEDLVGYDTNLKVNPPLRKSEDMIAIRDALFDGTVDCIASHHIPQHWDDKTCEFEYAKNGMIGLETVFGAINSYSTNLDKLIDMLTVSPRRLFGLHTGSIREGATTCLTLFNPAAEFTFEESMIRSRSHNSAFIGKQLKGKVIGIINKQKVILN